MFLYSWGIGIYQPKYLHRCYHTVIIKTDAWNYLRLTSAVSKMDTASLHWEGTEQVQKRAVVRGLHTHWLVIPQKFSAAFINSHTWLLHFGPQTIENWLKNSGLFSSGNVCWFWNTLCYLFRCWFQFEAVLGENLQTMGCLKLQTANSLPACWSVFSQQPASKRKAENTGNLNF